ncbi:DNA excision repair protein [Lasiodiplodia theobromae]|uniref:DNA excision repair protein n=1 Tax=Lasiodiplodia theobromae TaxID=45133 RepID=UPI0015C3B0CF|nr:DNA excision repair protein [Lasiodiplodia theobromae]KAF4543589.1 DNA excision repair protein [Lasiodiplodia theobromae]
MARGRPRVSAQSASSTGSPAAKSVTPINSRTRSLRSRTFVPNSSDSEDELTTATPKVGTLKAVAIMSAPRATRSSGKKATSTESSIDSTSRDHSAEIDTPATSYSNTPAPSTRTKRTRSTRASQVKIENRDTTNDEEIALALQEQEYGNGNFKKPKREINDSEDDDDEDDQSWNPFRPVVKDTDEEDLSPAPSDLSAEDFLPLASGSKGKAKAQPPRTTKLPTRSRAGRASNNKMVLDSESEAVSLSNDDSTDDFEDSASEDDSEDVESLDIPLINQVASAGQASTTDTTRFNVPQLTEEQRARLREGYHRIEDLRERRKKRHRDNFERSHPELHSMWKDLQKIPIIKPTPAPQPASISRKLKSFQLEGLDWMIKQEKTPYKGGLLGDEMGMGKTIQAVSLIMSDYPAKAPTLVLVPPVALMQWSNEINDYTDGKLKVLVYHGSNAKSKKLNVKDLKKYDVIMISYNSLESLHRKQVKGWTRGDEIIKEASPIHAIEYHRLILDEAHSIKQRTTGVAKACFALKGKYKWCLSGTPVQNRIGEFFSLLRFLEVRPFADYFCKQCSCAQLHWTLDKDFKCSECRHAGAQHLSVFNQELLNPITGDDPVKRKQALDKLHMITSRIMLRRMKRDHTSSMELPPKEIKIHNEFFGEVERDFSSSIMTNTHRQFDTYVSRGVMLNNYANIFGLIMQMRQVADHPDLILKKKNEGGQNVLVCNICDEPAEEAIKSRCHHEFCRACVKNYVQTCEASDADADCPRCHIPLSIDWEQPDIEQDEDLVKKNSIINRIKMDEWTSSTKIEMLIYDLYKLRSKKQTLKSIVFSQFTSMLQLIEWRLRRAGFNTVMLDGSMSPVQRQRSIEYFMKNADVEVFLVSLKAGGVALNLTEASRVFIVDPWWNPAAEWQSADRCHRIGQKRPCVITRLVIEDSVESRIVMLQEKKAALINGTVNNDQVAIEKLTPEDMQFLFRGT